MIGLGRPLIADPSTPARLLTGEIDSALAPERSLSVFHVLPWFNVQMERLADGSDPDFSLAGPDAVKEFVRMETGRTMALLQARRTSVA